MYPSYLELYENKRLDKVIDSAFKLLKSCAICPRICRVNRLQNEMGFCRTGILPRVYSSLAHHGEEPPISGKYGSGTIFFSGCNMGCVYCQNFEFSQMEEGKETSFEELAGIMIKLQDMRCHNINFVTPTHIMPQILKALKIAISKGLKVPLVYNTGGYELPGIIRMLEGIIDIYMPDMRYSENDMSEKYSNAPDYPEYNRESVKEMHRQTGIAQINKEGIIEKGLLIRHLVLPKKSSGTKKVMRFISQELSKDTYISLMSQYHPYYRADKYAEISRKISLEEYESAIKSMGEYGLHNGWTQESQGLDRFAGINIKSNVE